MNDHSKREALEDVLDAYLASTLEPNHPTLAEWVHKYPYYAQELTEFTVNWSHLEQLRPSPKIQIVDEERLVLHGMSIVQNIMHASNQAPSSQVKEKPLQGIIEEGKFLGLSPPQLAESTWLSLALMRKLDRCLIRYASLPREVIESLAKVLHRDMITVTHYLQGTPTLPQGASYKAEQAPTLANPENFFDAVRQDVGMKKEWRDRWLALADPEA